MKNRSYKTPNEIAVLGFTALVDKLGPGGAIQFLNQYDSGKGNYTKERKKIFKGKTLSDFKREIHGKKSSA